MNFYTGFQVMFNIDNIWVPEPEQYFDCIDDLREYLFYFVETESGSYLSREKYAALYYQKIIKLIENDKKDDPENFLDSIESSFPSLEDTNKTVSNEELAWNIIESSEFYFGFPPIESQDINLVHFSCIKLPSICDFELSDLSYFMSNYSIFDLMNYTCELSYDFLARNHDR